MARAAPQSAHLPGQGKMEQPKDYASELEEWEAAPDYIRPVRGHPVVIAAIWFLALLGLSVATVVVAVLVFALLSGRGWAHEAPTGWSYGWECCSDHGCRELPQGSVEERPNGYLIRATGEVIPYGDKRIKQSKDEFYHQCTPGGKTDSPYSICLYVPDRGF